MPYFLKMGQTQESCAAMNPRSTPLSAVTPPTSMQPPARHGLAHDAHIQAAAPPQFLQSLLPPRPQPSQSLYEYPLAPFYAASTSGAMQSDVPTVESTFSRLTLPVHISCCCRCCYRTK